MDELKGISLKEATARAALGMERFAYAMSGPHLDEPTPIHDQLMAEYRARHRKPTLLRQVLTYLGIVSEAPPNALPLSIFKED